MDGFLTTVFIAFVGAPVFAVPVTEFEKPFKEDPSGRGTISLLLSCSATFFLCIWTTVHPNILPGSTIYSRLTYKLIWMLYAAFIPEFILLCAFGQWRKATELHREYKQSLVKEGEGEGEEVPDSLGIQGAWLVLMGGFTVRETEKYSSTLTPKGFQKYLECGLIDNNTFPQKLILDQGKSSAVAKTLVFIQASWMIFQCFSRWLGGLPITLLEIHVAIQVIYTLLTTLCWWSKPLDVNQSIKIVLNQQKLMELERSRHSDITIHQPLLTKALDPEETIIYSTPSTTDDVTISPGRYLRVLLDQDYDGARPPPENETLEKAQSSTSENAPKPQIVMLRELQWPQDDLQASSPGHDLSPYTLKETSEHQGEYYIITEKPRKHFINILLRAVFDILEYSIGKGSVDKGSAGKGSLVMAITILSVSSGGALHLMAWSTYYPTDVEKWLWRGSCLIITFGSIIYTCILLYTHHDRGIFKGCWDLRFKDENRIWGIWQEVIKLIRESGNWLKSVLCAFVWLLNCLYPILMIYITIEAFISIRKLPKGSYDTTKWNGTAYWPHIG